MEESQSLGQAVGRRQTFADRVAGKVGRSFSLNKRTRPFERGIAVFLFACAALSIFTTVAFTIILGSEAINFFATTEWLNPNKTLTAPISVEDTVIRLTPGGSRLNVGDDIRIGQASNAEIVEIVNIIDETTFEVTRGFRGTEVQEHPSNLAVFVGAQPTLDVFLTGTNWAPQIGRFGVLPLVTATFVTSVIAMMVAVPLGLGSAIYLSEYASAKVRGVLKPMVEVLAGVPTVVYGYFALTFVTPFLRSIFGQQVQVYNQLSAGLVVGILIIPTIASISEDALHAVPNSLREASYGMGATRLETVYKVLLPAALSGISAAIILGLSRAVGETMIVTIASGAGPNLSLNPFDQGETMAGHIARISTGDISRGSIDYTSVYAIGLTLFLATLVLNLASTMITRRFREKY